MGAAFSFQRGERIIARVVEIQMDRQILVSYQGQLIRVTNFSNKQLKVGEKLKLQVVGVNPLEFRMDESGQGFERVV